MIGYQGNLRRKGSINLGLQRASYRASFLNAASGLTSRSTDDAWLYNASFGLHLSKHIELFGGTQKGLEDSGAAPDNAANRAEQLPTTRSTQYEGGVRFTYGKNRLVASVFQITRPYFSFDAANRFTELGTARYRGAELSFTGHFDRLTALAGAVAMQPEVSGPGRTAGLVGDRPAGTPDLYARVDLQYRTDIFGGLTPTLTFTYTGRRAMGSNPVASLGGKQAMLDPNTSLDLGIRQRFKLGSYPASLRATFQNVLDHHGWKVIASNTLQPEEHRRFTMTLAADF
jgi:iron complex outermembrane receptor protein